MHVFQNHFEGSFMCVLQTSIAKQEKIRASERTTQRILDEFLVGHFPIFSLVYTKPCHPEGLKAASKKYSSASSAIHMMASLPSWPQIGLYDVPLRGRPK